MSITLLMRETHAVKFQSKPVSTIETLGELLVFARHQQGKTMEDAAAALQISPFYLEALEAGEYGKLPCLIYSRNFVKQYGEWLGLNIAPLVELFEQEWSLFEKLQQTLPQMPARQGVKKSDLWKVPRLLRWVGASLVICSVFTYLGYELYKLSLPPMLVLESPAAEVTIDKQIVQVTGQTEPEAKIMINNQPILSDSTGRFNERVALQPGVNVIEVQASKKYSRQNVQFRKIMVVEQPVLGDSGVKSEQPVS